MTKNDAKAEAFADGDNDQVCCGLWLVLYIVIALSIERNTFTAKNQTLSSYQSIYLGNPSGSQNFLHIPPLQTQTLSIPPQRKSQKR